MHKRLLFCVSFGLLIASLAVIAYFLSGIRADFSDCVKFVFKDVDKASIVDREVIDRHEQIVVFKNENGDIYGSAVLKVYFGHFYQLGSGAATYAVKTYGKAPFYKISVLHKNHYIIHVIVNDDRIQTLSFGTANRTADIEYYKSLTIGDVQKDPDTFTVGAVVNGGASIRGAANDYDSFLCKNMIMAYDADHQLCATATGTDYGKYLTQNAGDS